jgi:hypothetical protein
MIKGFDKLIKQEFNFPIMNAGGAMFRIDSVNEVKGDENKWYGVLGCRYIDNGTPYIGMPDYIVFTIEYKSGKFNITGMITNKGSFTIDASINEIDTMDGFLNQLKRIASLFDNATTI